MKVGVKLMSGLRTRLEKILDLHGQALSEAVGQREPTSPEACLSDRDLVLRFAGSDPTDGKSRTQWLVKIYIKDDKFKLEDLGRVDAALAAFERFKRKLPIEQREINHLKTLSALETLVDPFVKAEERARLTRDLSTATGRELRRLEEWKARDESIVVQEGEDIPTIAVPMTEFASQWWGRGTRWCTAADKDNAFMTYHKNAPLVIIVCPDGAKFQMNVKPDTFQFMDNTDKTVPQQIIRERWNEFETLFYWAVEQNGHALDYVPKAYRAEELCRIAVSKTGQALEYVNENKRTPELCSIAVQKTGRALYYVSNDQRTQELCRLALEQDGWALHYVPKEYRTYELCRLAIQQNGQALQYIPENERTTELCRLAIQKTGGALRFVPKDKITHELCRLTVQQNGRALYSVPKDYRTSELYCLAVEQNGLALEFIPKEQMIPKLCRLALKQNGDALQYIPEHKRTLELCRIAIQQNGEALYNVPEKKRTPELCRIAVEQNGLALHAVPENKRTPELCRLAVEQNGLALHAVPTEHKTSALLALIPPMQPKWHPDVLHGLGNPSKHVCSLS
jgi:tetratricopeptide (TPR) repeat protein